MTTTIQARLSNLLAADAGELFRFSLVGASGYLVNLAVYTGLIHLGLHYLPAAALAFMTAFVNNYTANRRWTFRAQVGSACDQGVRYLALSLATLGGNLFVLHSLVGLHIGELLAQATAVVVMTPLNFLGSKLWAFASPQANAA